jgi:hypothetical protein
MGQTPGMTLRVQCLCVDSRDPERIAQFWAAALGWRITFSKPDQVVLEPAVGSPEDGVAADILFLLVPEGKTVKNRLHLDLRPSDDQQAEVRRLQELGATLVSVGQEGNCKADWIVMADPEGNEFDVLVPFGAPDEAAAGGQ